MKKIIRYHGSNNRDIKEFNLDYLEKGEHQDGVGIYFTLNKKDTDYYSGINGCVYEVELNPKKMLKQTQIISEGVIMNLIKHSPNYDEFIHDFIDLGQKKLTKFQICKTISSFYKDMQPKEFFRSFSGDIYSGQLKELLNNFVKFSGYDMMMIDFGTEVKNVVVFNPKIIEIKQRMNVEIQQEEKSEVTQSLNM